MNDMQTPVWELTGMTGTEPGLLKLSKEVLSFETAQGVRFTCPVTQLADVKWPWYSFHCALNLNANGAKYRLSFARPNGAAAAWRPASAAQGVLDLSGASKTGKAWRAEHDKR